MFITKKGQKSCSVRKPIIDNSSKFKQSSSIKAN